MRSRSTSPARPRPALRTAVLAVALTLALTAGCSGGAGGDADGATSTPSGVAADARLAGMVRDPAPLMPEVPFFQPDGSTLWFKARPGQVHLWFFGYTACPDVCPTTMADVRAAKAELGDDAARVEVTFVSVDLERDTTATADAFVTSFDPDATGLVMPADQLGWVESLFGATSSASTAADGTVEVEHTGFLYAVDDQGRLRVQWPFGTPADELTKDLRLLLDPPASLTAAPTDTGNAPDPIVDPATGGITYVIPAGTQERQKAGEVVEIVPQIMQVKVGQPIAIRNEDSVAHTVGPFFVGAGETSNYRFRSPQTVAGDCSLHPSGRLEIQVTA